MGKNIRTILFIDDDEDDYFLIQSYLSEIKGLEVDLRWASTYEAGWDILPEAAWDAVLIDYDLGARDGIEFIREAISKGSQAPFIMITGRGSYEKDVDAMEAGAVDYLTKTEVNTTLLERVIRYAIDRRNTQKELERQVEERTQELQVAIEELQVYAEELEQQNEELANAEIRTDSDFFHYKEFFVFSPEGFLITDRSGKILDVNRKASILLNVEPRFLAGMPLAAFISADQQRAFYRVLNENFEPGQSRTFHTYLQPRGGKLLHSVLTVAPLHAREEEVKELCWLIHAGNG